MNANLPCLPTLAKLLMALPAENRAGVKAFFIAGHGDKRLRPSPSEASGRVCKGKGKGKG